MWLLETRISTVNKTL